MIFFPKILNTVNLQVIEEDADRSHSRISPFVPERNFIAHMQNRIPAACINETSIKI